MIFETISLSVITLLLLILMLSRKGGGAIKLLLGLLTAAASAAAMVCFILMQRAAGNPDAGKELFQMYVPCGIYVVVALWGLLTAVGIHRKHKQEKAAKRALKEAKKREAEAAAKTE